MFSRPFSTDCVVWDLFVCLLNTLWRAVRIFRDVLEDALKLSNGYPDMSVVFNTLLTGSLQHSIFAGLILASFAGLVIVKAQGNW